MALTERDRVMDGGLTFKNIQDQKTMDNIAGMKGAQQISGGYKVPLPSYGRPAPPATSYGGGSQSRARPTYQPPQQPSTPAPGQESLDYFRKQDSAARMSSGGSGSTASGNYTSTQSWQPSGEAMPTLEAGTFKAPEFDERKVSDYSQKFAAPNIRRLRDTVQAALSTPEDNPNVGALKKRQTLQGFGQGLEDVMAGAYGQALTKYNQEYSRAYNEGMTNFNAAESSRRNNFEAAINRWMRLGTSTTTRTGSSSLEESGITQGRKGKLYKDGRPMF